VLRKQSLLEMLDAWLEALVLETSAPLLPDGHPASVLGRQLCQGPTQLPAKGRAAAAPLARPPQGL